MFKRIIGLAKPHWLLLSASILASIVFVFFNSLSIWLTASFISNILIDFDTLVGIQKELITSNERTANETLKMLTNKLILGSTPLDTLKRLCISIFFIFILKNIFLYLKNFSAGLMQLRVITSLRNQLFNHLTSLSLSFFSSKRAGDLTSIVLNDVATMRRTFSVSFQKLLVEPINILTFVSLLILINWKLALAAILILPMAILLMVWVGNSIRRKAKRSSIQIAGIVSILQEVLGAIRIVKAANNPKSAVGVKLEKTRIKKPVTKIPVVVIIASPVVIIVLSLANL